METHRKITLDFCSGYMYELTEARQGDVKSRYIDVTLTDENNIVNLTQEMSAIVNATINGIIVAEEETAFVDTENNIIVVELTENMLSIPGILKIDLTVLENDSKITARIFKVKVVGAVIGDESKFEPCGNTIGETVKEVAAARGNYANLGERLSASDEALAEKANADDVYSVEEADDHFLSKHDAGITYAAKTELLEKANKAETYTKAETDTMLGSKADRADTLAGYGITDAYTKDNIDKSLKGKLNAMPFDSVPSLNSPSYLTSGAVYNALLEKYDASNIETGSGSLTVYTPAAIESGLIASADFRYHKTGKLAQIFFNIVFNAGSLNYIQFTGLPFGADTMSNQNRVVIATDKHNQAAVYPVGSWLSLNFMGKSFSFTQGEILKGVISIIIK